MSAPGLANEQERLAVLRKYAVLDSWPETAFDELTKLAAHICETPSALITFVDEDRQWFKSKVGFAATETPRDLSLCAHAIHQRDLMIVPDAAKDPRFADNPLVTAGPKIRFYAGAPLISSEGQPLGTLCVIDRVRRELTPAQQSALRVLSRHAMTHLEARRHAKTDGRAAPGRQQAESANGRISSIIEEADHAFVALDRNWCYTYVSAKAAQILSRQPGDLIGKQIWAEFPNRRGQLLYEAYRRALSAQEFVRFEDYSPGEDRWFEHRIYPTPDGLSVFFHDVTERKQADALLAGQNRVLEMIAQGEPLSRTLTALLRFLESQSPNMLCSVLLLDDDGVHVRTGAAPSLPEAFNRAIDGQPIGPRAGSCGTAAHRREPVVVEDTAVDPLWEAYRPLALAHGLRAAWSTPIFDASRRVLGTFAIYYHEPGRPPARHQELIDIATHVASVGISRHQAESLLRRNEERYRSTLDNILEGCQLIGFDWRYLYLNDTAARHNRRPNEELFGRTMMEAWPGIEATPVFALLRRCMIERIALHEEIEFVFADGSRGWYDVRSQPVPEGIFALSIDVTERKRSEQSLQASHEQLRALANRLQTVREEQSTHIAREIHDVLGQQLTALKMELTSLKRRASGITEEVLKTSFTGKLGSATQLVDATIQAVQKIATELRPGTLDKLGLTAALEREARDFARRSGLRCRCEIATEPFDVNGTTAIGIFRIVQEAFTNIARHAHATEFRVSLQRQADGLVVEVHDDGRGFDATRIADTTSLGLLGMQERARLLKGRIDVQSTSEAGTSVTLHVPLSS